MSKKASNSKPIYQKLWFWAIVIVIVGGIGIGIANNNSGPKKVGENGEGSQTQTDFKVGDVISVDNAEISVTKVERNYSTGNQYITPKSGKEFVKATISIENKSNDTIPFNIFNWNIEDSSGVIDSYSVLASADDSLGSGDLAKGGKKIGTIVFEVPAGDTNLKIHYKPSMFSSKEVIIHL